MVLMGRRASWACLVVVASVALGAAGCAGGRRVVGASTRSTVAAASVSPAALRSCPGSVRRLGVIAFTARGRLELVDLVRCHATVLASVAATDVRFSPDGRWLAYSRLVNDAPAGPDGGLGARRSGPVAAGGRDR